MHFLNIFIFKPMSQNKKGKHSSKNRLQCVSFTFIYNFCVENLSLKKPSIKNLNSVSFSNIRSVYT